VAEPVAPQVRPEPKKPVAATAKKPEQPAAKDTEATKKIQRPTPPGKHPLGSNRQSSGKR
jgi:hypothetical protein